VRHPQSVSAAALRPDHRFNRGVKNMASIRKIILNRKGATAIEYGLIAALIAVAAIAGMSSLGGSLGTAFNTIGGKLDTHVQ